MSMSLGRGARFWSLEGMTGAVVPTATPLYVAFYFQSNSGGTANPMSYSTPLSVLAGYEIATPGGASGYVRKRIDPLLGPSFQNGLGFLERKNPADIDCFTATGALLQTVSGAKQISHAVITSQPTANTAVLSDIWAYGPIVGPLSAWTVGDTLRVLAGDLSVQQGG